MSTSTKDAHLATTTESDARWTAVVGNDGALSGYRWGVQRKRTLLEKEANA